MLHNVTLMIVVLLTILAALGALTGGYVALRSRNKLHIAMAITSGLVLGLVAFDLLPEIFEEAERARLDTVWPMVLFALGFLFFHAIEKFVLVHEDKESTYQPHQHPNLGVARALALAGHSFVDGLSIGIAFRLDPTVGYAVALAVIGHRFADGFDTTSFMIYHGNKIARIKQLMLIVVIMPILGGFMSFAIPLSEVALALYLGFFAGILMYIASSNILPQAHATNRSRLGLALTIGGVVFMLLVTRFI